MSTNRTEPGDREFQQEAGRITVEACNMLENEGIAPDSYIEAYEHFVMFEVAKLPVDKGSKVWPPARCDQLIDTVYFRVNRDIKTREAVHLRNAQLMEMPGMTEIAEALVARLRHVGVTKREVALGAVQEWVKPEMVERMIGEMFVEICQCEGWG